MTFFLTSSTANYDLLASATDYSMLTTNTSDNITIYDFTCDNISNTSRSFMFYNDMNNTIKKFNKTKTGDYEFNFNFSSKPSVTLEAFNKWIIVAQNSLTFKIEIPSDMDLTTINFRLIEISDIDYKLTIEGKKYNSEDLQKFKSIKIF